MKWRDLALDPVPQTDFFETRFHGKISPAAINFLSQLLKTNPYGITCGGSGSITGGEEGCFWVRWLVQGAADMSRMAL